MIDKKKSYETFDRASVVIYATAMGVRYPVHGAVQLNGNWTMESWTEQGSYYYDNTNGLDLVELEHRIKHNLWINVYRGHTFSHRSKDGADSGATSGRLACINLKIDCKKGEGL